MHAIAVSDSFVGVDIESHQFAARMVFALLQSGAANKVVGFGFEGHGEADACLKRISFRIEFVICKNQPGFNTHHVKRFKTHGFHAVFLTCVPNSIEHFKSVFWVAENFITQFTCVTRARHDDRRTFKMPDTRHSKAEPFEFGH